MLVGLSQFGLLQFKGEDAQAFLHAQLSCDVGNLQPGQAQYGSYNTPKGRMLASFLLWRDGTGFHMQLPRALRVPILKRLSMYILRSRVQASDVSDELVLLGVAGAKAETALTPLFSEVPASTLRLTTAQDATLLRLDDLRFEIIAPPRRARELHEALAETLPAAEPNAWDRLDIRAGIPFVTLPTQEQFVPQMANLDLIGGVSFNKGCYPGQEIVARMHYLGRLKQRMYLANVPGPAEPKPGDKLFSGLVGDQSSGMIVNAAPRAGRRTRRARRDTDRKRSARRGALAVAGRTQAQAPGTAIPRMKYDNQRVRMPHSYYIYYRVEPGVVRAAEQRIHELFGAVERTTGVCGRLLKKRGEPHLWMEIYENVADEDRFEHELAQAAGSLKAAEVLQAGSGRHVECFEG